MAEPGGLPFMGSYRVGHDWKDLAAVAAAVFSAGASFCIPQNQVFHVHLDFYFNACRCLGARVTQLGSPPGIWYVSILPAFELLGSSWDILVQPSLLWPPQLVFADAASLLKKLFFFFPEKKF